MAREWTSSHLQDEMKYIREVSGSQTGSTHQQLQSRFADDVAVCASSPAGERFLGEGEGAHVWTVRRDAAIHAEAHAGHQGTEGLRPTKNNNLY